MVYHKYSLTYINRLKHFNKKSRVVLRTFIMVTTMRKRNVKNTTTLHSQYIILVL